MGPRLALPRELGAQVPGGGLQHVRHYLSVDKRQARQLLISHIGQLPNWDLPSGYLSGRAAPLLLRPYNAVLF
mgnify:CR=1 FL=1